MSEDALPPVHSRPEAEQALGALFRAWLEHCGGDAFLPFFNLWLERFGGDAATTTYLKWAMWAAPDDDPMGGRSAAALLLEEVCRYQRARQYFADQLRRGIAPERL
jgi:hypothetical protein